MTWLSLQSLTRRSLLKQTKLPRTWSTSTRMQEKPQNSSNQQHIARSSIPTQKPSKMFTSWCKIIGAEYLWETLGLIMSELNANILLQCLLEDLLVSLTEFS